MSVGGFPRMLIREIEGRKIGTDGDHVDVGKTRGANEGLDGRVGDEDFLEHAKIVVSP